MCALCRALCFQIPSDPKLITATYEPDRLSKFFLTTVEQQPRRELLLPADVGIPIRFACCAVLCCGGFTELCFICVLKLHLKCKAVLLC
jgi:hypothetical protein